MATNGGGAGGFWLGFVLLTVVTWGLYGVLLHAGQAAMGDPVHGRMKAFLWVGVAYFAIAVLAPALLLAWQKAGWTMPPRGVAWSLAAGAAGAVGAFGVLLAFGARGHPAVVMALVFAGAPVVNACTALLLHPPAGGLRGLRWQFVAGLLLAALGGMLVTWFKPAPARTGAPPPSAALPHER